MQNVALIQDTSSRPANGAAGFGLATTDHALPFHRSVSVVVASPRVPAVPTAKQNVALTHDAPDNELPSVEWPGRMRLGLGTIDHVLPFHRSVSVRAPSPLLPTAKQLVVPVHDTSASALTAPPDGLGLGTIDHALPFHRSTSVRSFAPGLPDCPTAKQLVVLGHATPDSDVAYA